MSEAEAETEQGTEPLAGAPEEDARISRTRSARGELCGLRETRQMPSRGFEMREVPNGHGGSDLVCSAYASVTCANRDDSSAAYEMEDMFGTYAESTLRGFATKTIAEGCDTVFWPNHGAGGMLPMARTAAGSLRLLEDNIGLFYEARINASRGDVKVLRAAIEDGIVTESSFAFRVIRDTWTEDYDQRWIQEISLARGDVSPVSYGANPHTGDYPISMRSAMTILNARGITWRAFAGALKDIRAGAALSQATLDVLQPILDDLAAIDKLTDADQPKLAALLGVANPDEDDEMGEMSESSGDEGRSSPVIVLPDHTTSARAALAAARR